MKSCFEKIEVGDIVQINTDFLSCTEGYKTNIFPVIDKRLTFPSRRRFIVIGSDIFYPWLVESFELYPYLFYYDLFDYNCILKIKKKAK